MKFAKNPETRRQMETAFNSRSAVLVTYQMLIFAQIHKYNHVRSSIFIGRRCVEENTKILEELVELRQQVRFCSILLAKPNIAF